MKFSNLFIVVILFLSGCNDTSMSKDFSSKLISIKSLPPGWRQQESDDKNGGSSLFLETSTQNFVRYFSKNENKLIHYIYIYDDKNIAATEMNKKIDRSINYDGFSYKNSISTDYICLCDSNGCMYFIINNNILSILYTDDLSFNGHEMLLLLNSIKHNLITP